MDGDDGGVDERVSMKGKRGGIGSVVGEKPGRPVLLYVFHVSFGV